MSTAPAGMHVRPLLRYLGVLPVRLHEVRADCTLTPRFRLLQFALRPPRPLAPQTAQDADQDQLQVDEPEALCDAQCRADPRRRGCLRSRHGALQVRPRNDRALRVCDGEGSFRRRKAPQRRVRVTRHGLRSQVDALVDRACPAHRRCVGVGAGGWDVGRAACCLLSCPILTPFSSSLAPPMHLLNSHAFLPSSAGAPISTAATGGGGKAFEAADGGTAGASLEGCCVMEVCSPGSSTLETDL
jgi:hypothetical protein